MPGPIHHNHDLAVLLGLLIILLFASPLADWWARAGLPWYLPYLLWAVTIAFGALLAYQRKSREP